MSTFSVAEQDVKNFFNINDEVLFKGKKFTISKAGKPTCPSGEPKTDIYLLLINKNQTLEIKISYKKDNADFLENKIKSERAEQLFGKNWESIIHSSTMRIEDKFLSKKLIYKIQKGRTSKGSITLGWKFELVNKPNGELSGELILDKSQLLDIYAGNNLSIDKRNAIVNGEVISNSGVANYILQGNTFLSAQEILDKMEEIDDFVNTSPKIYFACKALNYRTFENKFDGDRPLAVQIEWKIIEDKLSPNFIFNRPLSFNGNIVAENLKNCLSHLNIRNTDDINSNNAMKDYIYE